jgi:hypothetical protein
MNGLGVGPVTRKHLLALISSLALLASGDPVASDTSAALTVSLEDTTYFTAPDGNEVIAPAGSYRVEPADEFGLRLLPTAGKKALLIQAQGLTHEEHLDHPLALTIPQDGQVTHLVLLLTGGKGLDAVGSSSRVRGRGLLSQFVTSDQLKLYVALKLDQQAKASSTQASPPPGHQELVRELLGILSAQPGGKEMIAAAERKGARATSQAFYSVTLTPSQPRGKQASLSISQAPAGALESVAVQVKIPRAAWYLINLKVTAPSQSMRAALTRQRIIKTALPGKSAKSPPATIQQWDLPADPGSESSLPALAELKAGEYEFTWTFTSGSGELVEARLLSL